MNLKFTSAQRENQNIPLKSVNFIPFAMVEIEYLQVMNIFNSFQRNDLASKIYAIIASLAVMLMLHKTFFNIHWFVSGEDYSSFRISDWLINYSDGFIRRGLLGTLLLRFYNLFPHPISMTIAVILILCFLGLLILILKVCRDEKLSYAYGDSRGDRELLNEADHAFYRRFPSLPQ